MAGHLGTTIKQQLKTSVQLTCFFSLSRTLDHETGMPTLRMGFSLQVARSRKSLTDMPRGDPLLISCFVKLTILAITSSKPHGTFSG